MLANYDVDIKHLKIVKKIVNRALKVLLNVINEGFIMTFNFIVIVAATFIE